MHVGLQRLKGRVDADIVFPRYNFGFEFLVMNLNYFCWSTSFESSTTIFTKWSLFRVLSTGSTSVYALVWFVTVCLLGTEYL